MISPVIYNALVKFRSETVCNPNGPDDMTRYLTELKYINVIDNDVLPDLTIRPIAWEITPLGLDALSKVEVERTKDEKQQSKEKAAEAKRLQERHEDYTNEERRHRTQNKIAIVMPFVTFALGLLVEHFFQIVGFLFSLFH